MNNQSEFPHAMDLSTEELIQAAVENNEGVIASNGAFSTSTGERTGRSPNDRFIVKESQTADLIDWGEVNKPFDEENFDLLWNKVKSYISEKNAYISKVHVGSHDDHYLPVQVTTETAWHSLFARLIFVCTSEYNPSNKKEWEIISAANFKCNPETDGTNSDSCVVINFAQRKVIIAGMKYAGELKNLCSQFKIFYFLKKEFCLCTALQMLMRKVMLLYSLDYQEQEKLPCLLIHNAH
jgi:phosphoenolpyruvate carboxykinase (ATP)